jgi:hypothetical protein
MQLLGLEPNLSAWSSATRVTVVTNGPIMLVASSQTSPGYFEHSDLNASLPNELSGEKGAFEEGEVGPHRWRHHHGQCVVINGNAVS